MVSPQSSHVDGKVWAQNNGFAGIHRLDLATGKIETWEPFKDAPKGEPHNVYDVVPDSKNNVFFTDFRQKHIGRIDAKTGEIKLFALLTRARHAPRPDGCAGPALGRRVSRRQDRRCSTPRPRSSPSGPMPTRWTNPYDVADRQERRGLDGSMLNDRVVRLDTKTGDRGRISAAALDQHPARACRQFNDAGDLLGRQQPWRIR